MFDLESWNHADTNSTDVTSIVRCHQRMITAANATVPANIQLSFDGLADAVRALRATDNVPSALPAINAAITIAAATLPLPLPPLPAAGLPPCMELPVF